MSIKVNPRLADESSFHCRHNELSHRIDGDDKDSALYFGSIHPFSCFPLSCLVFDTTPDQIVLLSKEKTADLIATLAELVGLNVVITEQEGNDE